jgi:hypothetical protein
MRRVALAPSHYEVELRQAGRRDEQAGIGWRAIRRVGPDGAMQPLRFGTLQAAQAHAGRLGGREARIVAVEHGGRRRVMGADET